MNTMPSLLCRRCGQGIITRPGGLCVSCDPPALARKQDNAGTVANLPPAPPKTDAKVTAPKPAKPFRRIALKVILPPKPRKPFRRIALKVIRLPQPRAPKPPKPPRAPKPLPPGVPVCRHCHQRRAGRGRGLCWHCWEQPAIRSLYPTRAANPNGRSRGLGDAPLPPEPTRALPGSPEKVRVLEERAAAHLALWHPDDPVQATPAPVAEGIVTMAILTH